MATEIIEIKATARPRAGKGAARQARREGNIPAVIYGDSKPAETIALDHNELWKQVLKGHFTSSVFDVDVDGKENPRHPARGAGRSGQGPAAPRRLPARRQGRRHPRRGSRALRQ